MVNCPRCGAKGDEPCVYTAPRSLYYTEEQLRGRPSLAAEFARVGQPMTSLHQERSSLARARVWEQQAAQARERQLAKAQEARRRHPVLTIYDAEAAWDREERRQLVWWLARYADVLIYNS